MLSKQHQDLIVVPYDFTPEADSAVNHASSMAKVGNDKVALIHILNSESRSIIKKKGITEVQLRDKLSQICVENTNSNGVETIFEIREGSIFTSISEFVNEEKADLVVLGTHGVYGMQRFLGADVLRILEGCHAPGIVVQMKAPDAEGYSSIVVPVDENKFGKNKLAYASAVAKYFDAAICIYADYSSDKALSANIANNVRFAKELFEKNGVKVNVVQHEEAKGDFPKAVVRHATAIAADLIVISSRPDEVNIVDLFFGRTEEELINNEAMIPVMCVNPHQDLSHLNTNVFSW
ncbi:MAG: universal stress protein [Bacteroidetes bacterium]|nr:universal stress protein [Bacteroidota bacterium]